MWVRTFPAPPAGAIVIGLDQCVRSAGVAALQVSERGAPRRGEWHGYSERGPAIGRGLDIHVLACIPAGRVMEQEVHPGLVSGGIVRSHGQPGAVLVGQASSAA